MAPIVHLKPETAFNKAKDLIKVGKKNNALEILYELMKSRKIRFWQKNLEDIMILFIDLCVELKKNLHFRKVIHQYKNMTAMEYPHSLETVLRHYLTKIKGFTEEAYKESQSAVLDIEDLEALDTPESLMLNAVNQEDAQDRSNRLILMPWLRFLWDSYKNVLDLIKAAPNFENYYHEVAHEAFNFCITYQRRNEYKKLTETIRNHILRNNQMNSSISTLASMNEETISLHLRTRIKQLECAMTLGMYNDAYKTVEDVWSLILIKRRVKNKILIVSDIFYYYTKTAELFLQAGSYLFHAAALLKVFNFHQDHKKNSTVEELRPMACRVVCAILAIPMPHERMHYDKFPISGETNNSKMRTLASILELQKVPTRISLVNDLPKTLIDLLPSELKALLNIYEYEFKPLALYSISKDKLEYIKNNDELKVYYEPLIDVCASKTILQISQVYQCIKFSTLRKLCPFMDEIRLERLLVELIHNLELPMRIDHRNDVIHFDVHTDLGISQHKYGPLASTTTGNSSNPATDQLSRHLKIFSNVLKEVSDMIDTSTGKRPDVDPTIRNSLVNEYMKSTQRLTETFNSRRQQINLLRESTEITNNNRKKMIDELETQRVQEMQKKAKEEEERLQAEAHERERMRVQEDAKYIKKRCNITAFKNYVKENGPLPIAMNEENLDVDINQVIDKMVHEKREKHKNLCEKAKKNFANHDYLTRAMRLIEIPILKKIAEKEEENHNKLIEEYRIERIGISKADHAKSLKDRDRLKRMTGHVGTYLKMLKKKAEEKHEKDLDEWNEKMAEADERVAEAKKEYDEYLEERERQIEKENHEKALKLQMNGEKAPPAMSMPTTFQRGGFNRSSNDQNDQGLGNREGKYQPIKRDMPLGFVRNAPMEQNGNTNSNGPPSFRPSYRDQPSSNNSNPPPFRSSNRDSNFRSSGPPPPAMSAWTRSSMNKDSSKTSENNNRHQDNNNQGGWSKSRNY